MILPTASDALIEKLLEDKGSAIRSLNARIMRVGDIIRLTTASGNCYLFEIIDPNEQRAHMYRHKRRGSASGGYRGEKLLKNIIDVGHPITYYRVGGKHIHSTSAVTSIVLL